MDDPQRISTDVCDGFEIGWGITPDNRRVLLLTPTREGRVLGPPLSINFDTARIVVSRLQSTIAFAEAWKTKDSQNG